MLEGPFCPTAGCVTLVVGETKLGMVLQAPRVPEPWLISAAGTGTYRRALKPISSLPTANFQQRGQIWSS